MDFVASEKRIPWKRKLFSPWIINSCVWIISEEVSVKLQIYYFIAKGPKTAGRHATVDADGFQQVKSSKKNQKQLEKLAGEKLMKTTMMTESVADNLEENLRTSNAWDITVNLAVEHR